MRNASLMRNADCGMRSILAARSAKLGRAACRMPHAGRRAQASLELSIAMFGAILLLLGSLKVCLWLNERVVQRQQNYETNRGEAGSAMPDAEGKVRVVGWDDPAQALDLFGRTR